MIIVPKKNLYLPERIWGRRRFQRGIICATAIYGNAPPLVENFTMTVGRSGDFVEAGYNAPGLYGSMDPNPLPFPLVNGQALGKAFTDSSGAYGFEIDIGGTFLPQSFTTSVMVNDGGGTDRTFLTADADNFVSGVTSSQWRWTHADIFAWSDDGEDHACNFTTD